MRLKAEQLDNALTSPLKPVYLVYGDETLLVEEAADKIRQAARQAGATDREVWHVEGRFDWSQIKWHEQTLSLFASQRLIEIRLPSGSPGKDGGERLRQFAAKPPEDTTVLIISGKIAGAAQKSKWFTQLDKLGVSIPIWPVDIAQLPRWISQRLQQRGLNAEAQVSTLIAERVEGNLFAAAQEIDKLQLLAINGHLDQETVLQAVADNARFDAFELMDVAYLGHIQKVPRIIERLRAEGLDIMAIFSAVSWSLHRAVDMAVQLHHGAQLEQVFAAQKPPVWDKNKAVMRQALPRHHRDCWLGFLQQLAKIDQAAKGLNKSCPWRLLETLCLQIGGETQLPVEY